MRKPFNRKFNDDQTECEQCDIVTHPSESCGRAEGWLRTACVSSPRPVWPPLHSPPRFWEEESCGWSAAINRELSENCGRACSTRKERVGLQSAVAAAGRVTLLRCVYSIVRDALVAPFDLFLDPGHDREHTGGHLAADPPLNNINWRCRIVQDCHLAGLDKLLSLDVHLVLAGAHHAHKEGVRYSVHLVHRLVCTYRGCR